MWRWFGCHVDGVGCGLVLFKLSPYVFLLTPFSDLLPFLRGAVTFESVSSPANEVNVAFDVAKRGDELVEAWRVVVAFTGAITR